MIYLNNKYTVWYYNIIAKAKSRETTAGTEKHHIIPDCFFYERQRKGIPGKLMGNPLDSENLVSLTYKEHFVCHRLLVKMTTGRQKQQMSYALFLLMKTRGNSFIVSSRLYEKIRTEFTKQASITHSGKAVSAETRRKQSEARKGKTYEDMFGKEKAAAMKKNLQKKGKARSHSIETRHRISESNKGKHSNRNRYTHSYETKRKISESNKGRIVIVTEATKRKISNTLKGRPSPMRGRRSKYKGIPRSEEVKEKLRIAARNQVKKVCEYCNLLCSPSNYHRWHGKQCKLFINNQSFAQ